MATITVYPGKAPFTIPGDRMTDSGTMLPYEFYLFPHSIQDFLFLDKSANRAEVFLRTETGTTAGAFFLVDTEDFIALGNRLRRADTIPYTGITLNAFIADFIRH